MTQTSHIKWLAEAAKPRLTPIAAVRRDLAAWSERQPKPVQNAVANLDGWLAAAERVDPHADYDGVVVVDCVKRAVETLRHADRGSVLSAYGRSDG